MSAPANNLTFDQLPAYIESLSGLMSYVLVSHKESDGTYKSYAISFDDLAAQLNDMVTLSKGAAYCLSSDFALSDHDHDIYTSATYASKLGTSQITDVLSGTFSTTTHSTSWTMAIKTASTAGEAEQRQDIMDDIYAHLPKLGTLEMVCAKSLAYYDTYFNYQKPQFTGWVYANHSAYDLTTFVLSDDIKKVFKLENSDTKFRVPNLTEFCKIDDNNDSTSYQTFTGETHSKSHTHSLEYDPENTTIQIQDDNINTDITPDFTGRMSNQAFNGASLLYLLTQRKNGTPFMDFSTFGQGSCMDNGGEYAISVCSETSQENIQLNNLHIIPEQAGSSDIAYPSYNLMPVVVYVGPSIYSDLYGTYVTDIG